MQNNSYFVEVNSKSAWQPDYVTSRVGQIDFAQLKREGIKCVAFDIDCTITVNKSEDIDEDVARELKTRLDKAGIDKRFLASNSLRPLDTIARKLGGFHIHRPEKGKGKPSRHYYENLVQKSGCKPNQIVMIGDRGLQDIWGAKRAGLHAILVEIDPSHATLRDKIILRHIWQPILVGRKARIYSKV